MSISLQDLPFHSATQGGTLEVRAGGVLSDAAIERLQWDEIRIRGLWVIKKTILRGCRIREWKIRYAGLYGTSLHDCVLDRMHLPSVEGIESMTGCTVNGLFRAYLSGRHRIEGNDFSRAIGVGFEDGVKLERNTFASDGSQLVLHRDHPRWQAVRDRAMAGDVVANTLIQRLKGKQAWTVLYISQTDPEDWLFYTRLFAPPEVVSSALAGAEPRSVIPSFGRGFVDLVVAATDDDAWRAATTSASRPLADVELTPSGLDPLAVTLGQPPGGTSVVVRDDEQRMLIRLSREMTAALAQLPEEALPEIASDWARGILEILEEDEWVDDPVLFLSHLVAAAKDVGQRSVYVVLIA